MGINFPSHPPTGQKFPDPALPNLPVWQWNGTAWVQISGGGGGGSGAASSITFAPGGNISATDVQAAILELDTEKAALASVPPPATVAPIMDSAAAVGTATKYAREDHVHPSDTSRATVAYVDTGDANALKYTAQTLTSETPPYGTTVTQRAQARINIYAAPADALSYSGLQINGSCEVSQERGTTAVAITASATYIQDGWRGLITSAPLAINGWPQYGGLTPMPPGLTNCVMLAVGTPKASLAAGDYVVLDHLIEGYRIARLAWGTTNAQPLSIGFWVYTTIPGTMSVTVCNGPTTNRSYISNVVINAATTWEYKTLTIPGDTTGTWVKDNTLGILLRFCFGAGTTSQSSAGSWLGTSSFATAATTNFVAAANVCAVTGVVVLPGVELPSAARSALIMRSFDQELLTCQRYFYNGVPEAKGLVVAATAIGRLGCLHPVPMRTAPTLILTANLPVYAIATSTITSVQNFSTARSLEFDGLGAAGLTVGYAATLYQGAGGNLNVDARL
jgi:hypothetical protein